MVVVLPAMGRRCGNTTNTAEEGDDRSSRNKQETNTITMKACASAPPDGLMPYALRTVRGGCLRS